MESKVAPILLLSLLLFPMAATPLDASLADARDIYFVSPPLRYNPAGIPPNEYVALARQAVEPYTSIIESIGGTIVEVLGIPPGMLAMLTPSQVAFLSRMGWYIEQASLTFRLPPLEYNTIDYAPEYTWAVDALAAQGARTALGGDGTILGIIGTGIDPGTPGISLYTSIPGSPDYPGGYVKVHSGRLVCGVVEDDAGGYTNILATIAAGDWDVGIAPSSTVRVADVYENSVYTTLADILLALDWMVDPTDCLGTPVDAPVPDVVLILAEANYTGNALLAAIEALLAMGIAVISTHTQGAAGHPGNVWGVATATPLDANKIVYQGITGGVVEWPDPPEQWPFGGGYPTTYLKPDFAAPGVLVPAHDGTGYVLATGSSVSAATLAGAFLLLYDASYDALRGNSYTIIYSVARGTALDLGEPGSDSVYGSGLVQVDQAARELQRYTSVSVQGRVVDSVSRAPVAWATVYVHGTSISAEVDANGWFTLSLPPGEYVLVAKAYGYNPESRYIVVEPGVPVTVEFELQRVPYGTVVFNVTEAGGGPLPGATVEVYERGTGVRVPWTPAYTGQDGVLRLWLPEGEYDVVVDARGFKRELLTIRVIAGGSQTISVELERLIVIPIGVAASIDAHPLHGVEAIIVIYDPQTGIPLDPEDMSVDLWSGGWVPVDPERLEAGVYRVEAPALLVAEPGSYLLRVAAFKETSNAELQAVQVFPFTVPRLMMDVLELLGEVNHSLGQANLRLATIAELLQTIDERTGDAYGILSGVEERVNAAYALLGEVNKTTAALLLYANRMENGTMPEIRSILGSMASRLDSVYGILSEVRGDVAVIRVGVHYVLGNLTELDLRIVDVYDNLAILNTSVGLVAAKMDDLALLFEGRTVELVRILGEGVAGLDARTMYIVANLTALNAKLDRLQGSMLVFETRLGEVAASLDKATVVINGTAYKLGQLDPDTLARVIADSIAADIEEVKAKLNELSTAAPETVTVTQTATVVETVERTTTVTVTQERVVEGGEGGGGAWMMLALLVLVAIAGVGALYMRSRRS